MDANAKELLLTLPHHPHEISSKIANATIKNRGHSLDTAEIIGLKKLLLSYIYS